MTSSSSPSGSSGPDFAWILNRMKNMIVNPVGTWSEVKSESWSVKDIYIKWYMIVAALPPIAQVISFYTHPMPALPPEAMNNPMMQSFAKALMPSFSRTLTTAIGMYVIALAMLFISAKIIQFLATKFGGNPDTPSAAKFMAYGGTPHQASGLLTWLPIPVLPGLAALGLGIYSIYVYWVGITPMLGVPESKRIVFTIASIVCLAIVSIVMYMFLLPLFIFA